MLAAVKDPNRVKCPPILDGGEIVRRVIAQGLALLPRRRDAAQAAGEVEAARLDW